MNIDSETLAALFHENSKFPDLKPTYSYLEANHPYERSYKNYERKAEFDLSFDTADTPLHRIVNNRRSPPNFETVACDQEELVATLAGAKATGTRRDITLRAYPSGGFRYPVDLYISIQSIDGFPPGIYYFDPISESLRQISDRPIQSALYDMNDQPYTKNASFVTILTATFQLTTEKYGIRGYRYAYFEAGHIAQNLLLCAETTALSGRPIGGFVDDEVDEFLGIDDTRETSLYLCAFGYPRSEDSD